MQEIWAPSRCRNRRRQRYVWIRSVPSRRRPRSRPHPTRALPIPPAAQEEVKKARVPMANRDYCVDVLIPLNECRRENYYLPWKCEHERHAYELCQYKLYKLRTEH